ncbi:MAG: ABC transporter ATP-binding protein [Gudongella sp.]|nr:ABC transporter ATP-binding protein [Gudongella sp.]
MNFKEKVKRRFALSEDGYRNLRDSTISCMISDFLLMAPVVILFYLVADIIGDNEFAMNLGVWQYALVTVAAVLLIALAYHHQYNITYFRTYKESERVRISLAEKLRKLPLSYFAKKDPTDLTVRIMSDCSMQESAMTHWFPQLIAAMIYTSIIAVGVIVFNPLMGLASLWPVPVAVCIVLFSKKVQVKHFKRKLDKTLEATEGIQECLEAARDLKMNNAGRRYLDSLFEKMDKVERYEITAEYTCALFVVSANLVLKFGIVTTAMAGAYLLVNGSMSVMVFIAFLILISRLYDPFYVSLQNLAAMLNAELNLARLQEIEDQPVQTGGTEFRPKGYDISFDHVGFSYDGRKDVLKDVSFTAKQGEVTALIGPSGEGKTTAAKLSSRFWDVDRGRITVGGIDISGIDPETLLSCYSIVFQDVVLFNTTVMENIRIGRKGASDEEVLAAARSAACDEFADRLPEGYITVIGENGAKLSGGERQRISIARAILKGAPIILLDEATASLDTECETLVQRALSELVKDKTVVIVAHRMRTIEKAQRIVVLSNGVVAEQGTPEELKEKEGMFSRMLGMQASSENWAL